MRRARPVQNREIDQLTYKIIGAAMTVHDALGPGLLESAYEHCFGFELREIGLSFECQKPLPVVYKGVRIDCGYRLDFVVENRVVVELKAVKKLQDIHTAQTLSYLKLGDWRLGLLINFHDKSIKQGMKRIVNNLPVPQKHRRA